jgi:tetratricopeptide (TPR) repeat protein
VITGLADSLASWNKRQAAQAIEHKDVAGAVTRLAEALKWNHRDNQSRRQLARALNDLNRHPEAIEVWRELDKQLEGDAEALRNIAALSLEVRRTRDAAAAFRRLRDIEDDPETIKKLDEEIARLELMPDAPAPTIRSDGNGAPRD